MSWNPNSNKDLEFVKLNQGDSIIGKFQEQKDAFRKDGSPTRYYFLEVNGKNKAISTNSATLKRKMTDAPAGVNIKISYCNVKGKNFYNVDLIEEQDGE